MTSNEIRMDMVAQTITRELPFGLWCADFSARMLTGYNKFCELLHLTENVLAFDQLQFLIREDYRNIVMLNMGEIQDKGSFDMTFPTNHGWVRVKMTHLDAANNKAYGYIVEVQLETTLPNTSDSDRLRNMINKQNQLVHRLFNKIENGRFESITNNVLNDVLAICGADRISVIEFDRETNTQSCTYEATSYGIEPRINLLKDIPIDAVPWVAEAVHKHQEISFIYNIDNLSEDRKSAIDILYSNNVKSMIILPLSRKENVIGYALIDYIAKNHNMQSAENEWLRAIGRFIEFSISIINHERKHLNEKDQLKSMIDNMPFGYLYLKFSYNSKNKPNDLMILKSNNVIERMTNCRNLNGKYASQVFGKEMHHLLTVCNKVAKAGKKQLVDDFLYFNGVSYTADVMMPSFNEFICLLSQSSQVLYNANFNSDSHDKSDVVTLMKETQDVIITHLNAIMGFADLAANDTNEENRQKYINIIKDNVQSLLDTEFIKRSLEGDTESKGYDADDNRRRKILVAEDTESNYMLVSYILKSDFDLIWAHDGAEAIELYEQEHPDLILMDIRMPRIGGLTATSRIRERDKDTPIIALTAFAFESDKAKTIEAGCNDFVAKPINAKMLREVVNKYIK